MEAKYCRKQKRIYEIMRRRDLKKVLKLITAILWLQQVKMEHCSTYEKIVTWILLYWLSESSNHGISAQIKAQKSIAQYSRVSLCLNYNTKPYRIEHTTQLSFAKIKQHNVSTVTASMYYISSSAVQFDSYIYTVYTSANIYTHSLWTSTHKYKHKRRRTSHTILHNRLVGHCNTRAQQAIYVPVCVCCIDRHGLTMKSSSIYVENTSSQATANNRLYSISGFIYTVYTHCVIIIFVKLGFCFSCIQTMKNTL